MKWLTPFAFEDDAGKLHLCCDKACEAVGLPLTVENLRIAEHQLIKAMQKAQPNTCIVSNVERDIALNQDRIVEE